MKNIFENYIQSISLAMLHHPEAGIIWRNISNG
jgi:hypothetical protein